jgi:uncharacterized coiled-coil protein SlyX
MSNIITDDLNTITEDPTTPENSHGINADKALRDNSVSWRKLDSSVQAIVRSLAQTIEVQQAHDDLAAAIGNKADASDLAGKADASALEGKLDKTTFDSQVSTQTDLNSALYSAISGKAAQGDVEAAVARITALETDVGADEATLQQLADLITALENTDGDTLAAIDALQTAITALQNAGGNRVVAQLQASATGATTDYVFQANEPDVDITKDYDFYIDGVKVRPARVTASSSSGAVVFDLSLIPANGQPGEGSEIWVEGVAAA